MCVVRDVAPEQPTRRGHVPKCSFIFVISMNIALSPCPSSLKPDPAASPASQSSSIAEPDRD